MSEQFLKEFGDRIAIATNTNLCQHHRVDVARQLLLWLAEAEPTPSMMLKAGMALGEAHRAGKGRLGDAFLAQYRAALRALVT